MIDESNYENIFFLVPQDIGEDPSVDRSLWGELESESEEESEEEEEEEEETETQPPDESGNIIFNVYSYGFN